MAECTASEYALTVSGSQPAGSDSFMVTGSQPASSQGLRSDEDHIIISSQSQPPGSKGLRVSGPISLSHLIPGLKLNQVTT